MIAASDQDGPVTEPDFPVMTDAELQCTPRGQVLQLEGERTLFDLNRELEKRLAEKNPGPDSDSPAK